MNIFGMYNRTKPGLLELSPNEDLLRLINLWHVRFADMLHRHMLYPHIEARQMAAQYYFQVLLGGWALSHRWHERVAYCWRQENPQVADMGKDANPFNRIRDLSCGCNALTLPADLRKQSWEAVKMLSAECKAYTGLPLSAERGRFVTRPAVRARFGKYELIIDDETRKTDVLARMAAPMSKPVKRRREDEEEAAPKRLRLLPVAPPGGEAARRGVRARPAANRPKRKGGEQGGREPKRPRGGEAP
ncbi:hypothetical protein Dda_8525 [Drechslerella dactyloides]|uniref:Uncharacterized protein n=1 Tax=Drechslerella dactyloides TaxID=74499 RepID=A0AAD6NFR2_DREDA|nr:hypothetical protein Dda_8525 [Drechslerella dactyloides]